MTIQALLLMYHRGYKRLQELHWAESVFNFNHQSVPVAENSYMSTSGFVIAGDNVQAASILLSRFPYSFQCSLTPLKVFILFSWFPSSFQGSLPFMLSVSHNFLRTKTTFKRSKQNENSGKWEGRKRFRLKINYLETK